MIKGLDGLRAIAFGLVFLFHRGHLRCGWFGVQLFFVLSGFLITRILLRSKEIDESRRYFTVFYGRRVLRIFPVYYLYLFTMEGVYWAVTGLGLTPGEPLACFHSQWGYGLTYTMDFFHGSSGYVFTRLLSHFWSLAVEEQFYLVWPLVIWLVPERHMNRFLWGVVAAGPVLRFATLRIHGVEGIGTWMYWDASLALYVLPWSHFDAFATGALLSRIEIKRPQLGLGAMVVLVPLAGMAGGYAATGSVGPIDAMGCPLRLEHSGMQVWGYSALNWLFALLICTVVQGGGSWLQRGLENRCITYVGRVSYGLYLFHLPMIELVEWLQKVFERSLPAYTCTALTFALTLGVASASYHVFESRFLRLKDVLFSKAGERAASIFIPLRKAA